MNWFSSKPSRNEQREDALLAIISESQRLSAEREQRVLDLMSTFVQTVGAQSNISSDYLKLFTSAPAPVVRVMDDASELLSESKRKRPGLDLEKIEGPAVYLPDVDDMLSGLRESLI